MERDLYLNFQEKCNWIVTKTGLFSLFLAGIPSLGVALALRARPHLSTSFKPLGNTDFSRAALRFNGNSGKNFSGLLPEKNSKQPQKRSQ